MRTSAAVLLAIAVLATGPGSVLAGDDPAPDAAKDAAAKDAAPVDPVKQQLFADKEAEDALELIEGAQITELMEGLERLSRVSSKKFTARVVTFALEAAELHIAEFAGHALARADPEGALDVLAAELAPKKKKISPLRLRQVAGMLSELPAPRSVELLASDRLLGARNVVVRREAIRALGWHRSPKVLSVALDALGSKDAHLRNVACVALGRLGDEKAVAALVGKLNEKDGGTGGFAAIALGRIESGTAFWKIADPEVITRVVERIRGAKGTLMERIMPILGMRRNRNGFDLALELLESHKDGSKGEFQVDLALEKQTGHFFGNDPAVWREWIEANPNFFEKEQAEVEREKWRKDFLKENKGPRVTPATEVTVQRALDYLARHQDPSGAFDQQHFLDLCEEKRPCPTSSGARVQMEPIGMSGLCTLAFFGAGYGPDEGRYRGVNLARDGVHALAPAA